MCGNTRKYRVAHGWRVPMGSTATATAVLLTCLVSANTSQATEFSTHMLSDMDCVIEPSRTVELGSAAPGLLAESLFDRSDFVKKGTVMARLESEVERVTLALAREAAMSSTGIELKELTAQFGDRTRLRNARLLKSNSISEQVMDQVSTEAQIASLQVRQEEDAKRIALLELERAIVLLERREIRTPISGSVTKRYKSAGEFVDSDPVYQISQLDPLHVEVFVPVEYLGALQVGEEAQITIDLPDFSDNPLRGVLSRIDSVADAASATYGVRLELENPELSIPSGVRCTVDFMASYDN